MFLTKDDYFAFIQEKELDILCQNSEAIRVQAETQAQAKITAYLQRQYDCAFEFEQVGVTRNILLIEYMVAFVLYNLFQKIAKTQVPESRREHYFEAREYFEKVLEDKITTNFKRLANADGQDEDNPVIRFGSNQKLGNHYF
jgi:hypothetical protein